MAETEALHSYVVRGGAMAMMTAEHAGKEMSVGKPHEQMELTLDRGLRGAALDTETEG